MLRVGSLGAYEFQMGAKVLSHQPKDLHHDDHDALLG